MAKIIQIVPKVPPAVCGVGDHAWLLGNELETKHCIPSHFIAVEGSANASERCTVLHSKTPHHLVDCIRDLICVGEQIAVLVHFSGYAYANRGLCFWLANGLSRFHRAQSNVPIITMFHELWASGSWFSSALYIQPLQKYLVKSVARTSHAIFSNRSAYGTRLRAIAPNKQVCVRPVFSNFGEPTDLPSWSERRHQLLLFQPPALDSATGARFWGRCRELCQHLRPDRIIVAGRSRATPTDLPVEVTGILPAAEASRLLAESRFGYFEYYDGYLGKSSLLAAHAAHGVCCIMPNRNHSESEGLFEGEHYLTPDGVKSRDLQSFESVGMALYHWYGGHDLATTAARYAKTIEATLAEQNG